MATTEKKAVHFGAGNIGRGFVACFLHESGYHVTFADVMDNVVDQLNKTPSYKVNEVGVDGGDTKTITNYRAINSKYNEAELIDEISTSDVVTCSVGPNILKFIAPVIAQAIAKRSDSMKPLAVIACENMIGATSELAKYIHKYTEEKISKASLDSHHLHAAYANSAIDRIVPAQDPNAGLDVTLEQFYEWVVEEIPFNGDRPSIGGIKWTDNLKPFIERKLFTVNTSHATAAYFGYNRNKKTVDDAMLDKDIKAQVNAAINETASILVKKHGIPKADQDAYKEKIIKRISNPHLADAVERVGRAPLRKLGRNERFIGPAFELAEADMKCTALLEAAEMVFRFQNVEGDDESKELATIMAEKSADDIAKEVCGLNSSDKLYPMVVEVIKKVQNDRD